MGSRESGNKYWRIEPRGYQINQNQDRYDRPISALLGGGGGLRSDVGVRLYPFAVDNLRNTDPQHLGQGLQICNIWESPAGFPARNGFIGHTDGFGKLGLVSPSSFLVSAIS